MHRAGRARELGNPHDFRPTRDVRLGFPVIVPPTFCFNFANMGNHLPFLKKTDRRANEKEPSDKPSSVEEVISVTPSMAAPTTLEPHMHRPLHQGQLHSPPLTATTSKPVDVASATEPNEISYKDETKTLEAVEQSQVLQVEADVHVPSISATASIMEGQHIYTTSVAVPSEDGTGRTKHSTRTKRKHKTATHKRQHGELRSPYVQNCVQLFHSAVTLHNVFPFIC